MLQQLYSTPHYRDLQYFNSWLQNQVNQLNQLNQSILREVVFSRYQPPSRYTGEQFGVQYLYHQSGRSFTTTGDELNVQTDEGFTDVEDIDQPAITTPLDHDEDLITVAPPVNPDSDEEEEVMNIYNTRHKHYAFLSIILCVAFILL